jgi:hypothetical protein
MKADSGVNVAQPRVQISWKPRPANVSNEVYATLYCVTNKTHQFLLLSVVSELKE